MAKPVDFREVLPRIRRSKFRMRFKLDREDMIYIGKIGPEKIRQHAADLLNKRLVPAYPDNDGKQTPFKGHPVFKAQHATASCCRGCLAKWHKIPEGRELTVKERDEIIDMLLDWMDWSRGNSGS